MASTHARIGAGSVYGWKWNGVNKTEGVTEEARLVARDWVEEEANELHQCRKELVALKR